MAALMLRLRAAATAGGCRQFSSSAACLMLPSNKMYSLCEKKVVNIDSSKIEKEFESDHVMGSSHGWVGLMKEESDRVRCGSSSSLSLWNPMSGSRMKLPPIHTIPHYRGCRLMVEKLMVDDADCGRAIIVGFSNWLGVCCPGRCSEWTLFGQNKQYEDVVACSRSRVYSMNINDELVRWDISDPRRPRRKWKKWLYELGYDADDDEKKNFPRKSHLYSYKYFHLVYAEQSGQLFLVTRHYVEGMDPQGAEVDEPDLWNSDIYPEKTIGFDVHLVVENETTGKVKAVRYMEHSLDGLVMFVGINNSFAVAAADFPHLNPDSIYFTDHGSHVPKWVDDIYRGHDIGVYDYKNWTISSCYYPSHHHSFKGIRPFPFWLAPTSTLKG